MHSHIASSILDRSPPTTAAPSNAAAGIIGSSLVGAAAVMGGTMDSLLSSNAISKNQDQARRSSTPGANSAGGFSSIFNLKSVINSVTKTASNPQAAPSTSSFPVSSSAVASEPFNVELQSQSNSSLPQKSVQGILFSWVIYFVFVLFFTIFDEILF